MWRIISAGLNKILTVKQRAALALILIIGALGFGIISNWDEMVSNIKNGRSIPQPYHINVDVVLKNKKPQFRQEGNQIIETFESEVKILELKQGIKNHQPLYYANVKSPKLKDVFEVDMTEEMFKKLSVGETWFLRMEIYYSMKTGYSNKIDNQFVRKIEN